MLRVVWRNLNLSLSIRVRIMKAIGYCTKEGCTLQNITRELSLTIHSAYSMTSELHCPECRETIKVKLQKDS